MKKHKTQLNEKLLISQNVTPEQKQNILDLHELLHEIFNLAKNLNRKNLLNYDMGHMISKNVQNIEFKLQDDWNFQRNTMFHRYQNQIPGCMCPTMDNNDMLPSNHRWYNMSCPFHGQENDPLKIKKPDDITRRS